jgi:hypothetical protein
MKRRHLKIDFTGSAKTGYRGPHEGQTRFGASDFDIDLYTVHAADYAAAVRRGAAQVGGKIFPNVPGAPRGARGTIDRRAQGCLMAVDHAMRFSLRCDAEGSLDEARESVYRVLGCSFKPGGDRYNMFLFEAELLGMEILLGEWRGLGGKRTLQLHGFVSVPPDAPPDARLEDVDISLPIRDLLVSRGAGRWRVPSEDELMAEATYASTRDAELHSEEE